MSHLYSLIERLINLSIEHELIDDRDSIYIRNQLLNLFNETNYEKMPSETGTLYETLDALALTAKERGLIEDTLSAEDIFTSKMMNLFLDKPSVVNDTFNAHYTVSPKKATNYFYKLSQNSNYIKMDRIAKNKQFSTASPYGDIELTINLSKPEKDPKQIAAERLAPTSSYPPCLLCVENEGYAGTIKHPDRANHRMIRLQVHNEDWMMQYSPYLYYNEHCIVLSTKHTPMKITKDTFYNLLDFTTQFPHYFIGSNADLPIVGGSILSHEHYQGGCYTFPIDKAKDLFHFTIPAFNSIRGKALYWPLSTLELRSDTLEDLAECSNQILELWRSYSDASCEILAYSEEVPHNTITPICKREGSEYVMRLVLRNNRTTSEHPLGLFHPHEAVHHIKKENIGLIEVMGLAILPARLLSELELIKAYILSESNEVPPMHQLWADTLKTSYTPDHDLDTYIQNAVGHKFTTVLENAGVYKLDDTGINGFKNFVTTFANLGE